jgi:hypothetical protein
MGKTSIKGNENTEKVAFSCEMREFGRKKASAAWRFGFRMIITFPSALP